MTERVYFDVTVEQHGNIGLVQPLTPRGREWLQEHVSEESTWFAGALVVEPRYLEDLLAGMIADGLEVG